MKQLQKVTALKTLMDSYKTQGLTIGFVPTMGFLHEGHLSLVKRCKEECDVCVVSIYVNPSQFNEAADFDNYPSNLKQDIALLIENKCDVLWSPSVSDIESIPLNVNYDVKKYDLELEGEYRKGHFKGVIEVVYRLFTAVQPNVAFFGEKDFQQYKVIQAMILSNKLDISIVSVNTVREKDGLAMSSRNVRLAGLDREIAPELYAILNGLRAQCNRNIDAAKDLLIKKGFEVEYLTPHEFSDGERRIFAAVKLGNVRLIDNVTLD